MKIRNVFAVMAMATCAIITSGSMNESIVNAADNEKDFRPMYYGKLNDDKVDKKHYLDEEVIKGIAWDEKNKKLTLDGFEGDGSISFVIEDTKKDRSKYTRYVEIKGDNKVGALDSDCNLKISGDGTLGTYRAPENIDKNWYGFSIWTAYNVEIDSVTLNDVWISADELTIKNANLNRKFVPNKRFDNEESKNKKTEYDYTPWLEAAKMNINNSVLVADYKYLSKDQKKGKFYASNCIVANTYNIDSSIIDFKGSRKALNHVIALSQRTADKSKVRNSNIRLKKGMIISDELYRYKITKLGKKRNEVKLIKCDAVVADVVELNKNLNFLGRKYRLTAIGKGVFFEVVKVTFKTKNIRKIGKKAFWNYEGKKITFKVPKSAKKKYMKLLKKAGTKNYVVK
ncbi:hypothetical protein [Eubacterium sp.]|uniref:hypothetical protein n=1 Tax=Eubacterium sp. TaxID=142586 RepID=UPI0025D91B21|nr:hypothetical protein [Eubacterium sp.]MCR5629681.1 hypothetical protein [Eubacterium sp.]